jgi:D-arabinose 1-dehydrogenase-like Zn-dependent alcohol dehydrogenase
MPQSPHARHPTGRRLWYARYRSARALPLPHDGVPQSLATTYACSGITAFSALKKARGHLGTDDYLVIIGAGGVGSSAVHIAPAAVAGKVIVADIDAQKRAQARQMGAVATIDNAAPDAVKQVMEATDGGAAAAIDFVGSGRPTSPPVCNPWPRRTRSSSPANSDHRNGFR